MQRCLVPCAIKPQQAVASQRGLPATERMDAEVAHDIVCTRDGVGARWRKHSRIGSRSAIQREVLASHGVVVVNVNYRLGVFGFFAHPELTKNLGTMRLETTGWPIRSWPCGGSRRTSPNSAAIPRTSPSSANGRRQRRERTDCLSPDQGTVRPSDRRKRPGRRRTRDGGCGREASTSPRAWDSR